MFPGSLVSRGNLPQRNIFDNRKQHLDAEKTNSCVTRDRSPSLVDPSFGYEWCSECFRNMGTLL